MQAGVGIRAGEVDRTVIGTHRVPQAPCVAQGVRLSAQRVQALFSVRCPRRLAKALRRLSGVETDQRPPELEVSCGRRSGPGLSQRSPEVARRRVRRPFDERSLGRSAKPSHHLLIAGRLARQRVSGHPQLGRSVQTKNARCGPVGPAALSQWHLPVDRGARIG